jgi:hypothetical protein
MTLPFVFVECAENVRVENVELLNVPCANDQHGNIKICERAFEYIPSRLEVLALRTSSRPHLLTYTATTLTMY